MEIWDPDKMIIKKGKTGKYFAKWKYVSRIIFIQKGKTGKYCLMEI